MARIQCRPNPTSYSSGLGFTIVEVMAALVIGSLMMIGAITIMVNSKDTYEVQDDLARLQENARFAMDMLIKDIRMAGYFGCSANTGKTFDHVDSGGAGNLFDSGAGIEGLDNFNTGGSDRWTHSGSVAYVDGIAGVSFANGNDAVTIRYLEPSTAVSLSAPGMPDSAAVIDVDTVGSLQDGQIVAVTDCSSADIFQITNVQVTGGGGKLNHQTGSGTPGNVNSKVEFSFPNCNQPNCLSKSYPPGSKVMSLRAVRYFLSDDNGDGSPSFFRMIINPSAGNAVINVQKLVDGVDSLQITYGRDTNGDEVADTYSTAEDLYDANADIRAANWSLVSTVRIGMLLRTIDAYGQELDTNNRNVNGEVYPAQNDNHRRRLFTTTVLLRNPQ